MSDPYKEYVIDYPFAGARWGLTIKAASLDEAQRRIEAMGAFGHIKGELVMTIPGSVPSLFIRAIVWLRNLAARR